MPILYLLSGFVALYNISVCIISDIYDEHQLCTREITPTITEDHTPLSITQQDTATAVVSIVTAIEPTSPIDTYIMENSMTSALLEMEVTNSQRASASNIRYGGTLQRKEIFQTTVHKVFIYPNFNMQYSSHVFR